MPRIESYAFGSIRISGTTFRKDVIILGDKVISPWFREAGGHIFAPQDLKPIIEAAPEIVVLGTGAFARVRVLDETITALKNAGSHVEMERTKNAVARYNSLCAKGRDVAAALHLTC